MKIFMIVKRDIGNKNFDHFLLLIEYSNSVSDSSDIPFYIARKSGLEINIRYNYNYYMDCGTKTENHNHPG